MKKIISVLVSLIIVTCTISLGFNAFAKENIVKFAVASDLHYNQPSDELTVYDQSSELFGYANRRASMDDESGFIIDSFLNECAEDKSIQFVLIPGDTVDHGRTIPEDHEAVAEKFRDFEKKTGKPIYVINGNHDTGASETDFDNDDFRRVYYEFGFGEAITTMEGNLSYVVDIPNTNYRLIAADSCDPSVSTEDGLTTERVDWICNQAKLAYAAGKYPILMMHHNFIDHMPIQRIISRNFIVRNHSLTASKFADAGIKIAFTGHEHGGDVASHTSLKGNKIYDFSTTALTMYPLRYRIMTMSEDKVSYDYRTVSKIDTEALSQCTNGYTKDQLDYMNRDLDSYSKEFLKQGIKYRLALGFTMEKMGVEEDSPFYDLVKTAVGGLTNLLEMPLYGEGSVAELAAEYNIDLPQSNYANGWDVITELMAYHYAGDEPFTVDSPTVQLILKVAALLLLDDLSTVNDEVFFSAANKILSYVGMDGMFKNVTKLAAKVFGPYTAGELFVVAIASPIVYGFCLNSDEPDNVGEVEGYGTTVNNFANVVDNAGNIFEKISIYISLFFKYLSKFFTQIF